MYRASPVIIDAFRLAAYVYIGVYFLANLPDLRDIYNRSSVIVSCLSLTGAITWYRSRGARNFWPWHLLTTVLAVGQIYAHAFVLAEARASEDGVRQFIWQRLHVLPGSLDASNAWLSLLEVCNWSMFTMMCAATYMLYRYYKSAVSARVTLMCLESAKIVIWMVVLCARSSVAGDKTAALQMFRLHQLT